MSANGEILTESDLNTAAANEKDESGKMPKEGSSKYQNIRLIRWIGHVCKTKRRFGFAHSFFR